jgi:hypothetical protein
MKTLANEEIITRSDNDIITLTNKRVFMVQKESGKLYQISVFLDKISVIEQKYISYPLLLVLSVLFLLLGILGTVINNDGNNNAAPLAGGIFLGLIFLLIWYLTKRRVISITSDAGLSLNFDCTKMKEEIADDFIQKINTAIENRIINLKH